MLAGVVLVFVAVWIRRRTEPPPAPPGTVDVLLVSIDTLRADRLGAYGYAAAATPVLDDLATHGTRFAEVIAPVPLTLPSHASLLTAVTPLVHGVHDNVDYALGPALPTVAEAFAAAGYSTAAFVSGAPLQKPFGLARGFTYYDDQFTAGEGSRPPAVERRADRTGAAIGDWLQRESSQDARPLFLWAHFFDPHAPYEPPAPFNTRFQQQPYDGEVAFVDAQLGLLLARWKTARPGRRLIVAVTADHGEGLGDHHEPTHGLFVYDSTVRVPLILEGAGVPAGRVVDRLVRLIDLAPTLLDLAGLGPLAPAEGVSLRPAMEGSEGQARGPAAYVESQFGWLCCGWAPLRAWRDERLMFISAPRTELYDVAEDPQQLQNLADVRPADASRLHRALQDRVQAHPSAQAGRPSSLQTAAQLRSLGYLSGGATRPSLRDPKDMIGVSTLIGRSVEDEAENPARAVEGFRAALRDDPGNPLARRHLGIALIRLGRPSEAERVLNELAGDGDSSTETLTLLANLALERGDVTQARARLELLHVRLPSDAAIAFQLGLLLVQARELDRAAGLFRIVVAQEPENIDALVDLAGALLSAGHAGEAVTYFQRAIDVGATGTLAWNGLAFARASAGDTAGAAEAMRRSLQIEPDQPEIAATLANLAGSGRAPRK